MQIQNKKMTYKMKQIKNIYTPYKLLSRELLDLKIYNHFIILINQVVYF